MSDITLERLDERTKNHTDDIHGLKVQVGELQAEIKALWRIVYWFSGVCAVLVVLGPYLLPRIFKALGL